MTLIKVENVSKIHNPGRADEITALASVSLAVAAGEVVVLTGPSGSGKTTLLSLLGCMTRPTEGRIVVDGRDVAKLPEHFLTDVRRLMFGFIFQQFHLIRELTVLDNVLLPLLPTAVGIGEMKRRALPALEKLKIDNKAARKVKRLSGGEQQRVAIARALINDPRIIIADEPTAHLDSGLAEEFMAALKLLNGEGKTVIIASHDPFICDNPLIDRTFVMHDGRIERSE